MTLLLTLILADTIAHGWSADGEKFSYSWAEAQEPACSYLACGEQQWTKVVIDAVAGRRSAQEPSDVVDKKRATPERTSSTGISAAIEEKFTPASGQGCGTSLRQLELKLQKGGATTSSVTVAFSSGVETYFSPDGSRIAWVLDQPAGQVFVLPTQGPAMSIAASKNDTPGARKLARELDKKGFITTRMTIAQKDRDKSVVYAKPESMKQAQDLAALIPGASVDTINWKTSADVVLALAKGAMK
jgi:hypothetical protein